MRTRLRARSVSSPDRGGGVASRPAGVALSLVAQQVEHQVAMAEAAQDRMRLAAVMGLVIEEMRQGRREGLLELLGRGDAAVADSALELLFAKPVDIGDDAPVLHFARGTQLGQALVLDRVQLGRGGALTGEAV